MAAAEQKKSYQVIKQFKGLNTKANRTAIAEDEFSWIENAQPIGYGNVKITPASKAVTNATNVAVTFSNTTTHLASANLDVKDFILSFGADGSAQYYNITDKVLGNIAAPGFFSSSGIATSQFNNDKVFILDQKKGLFLWDGNNTVTVGSVGLLALTNGGSGYTSAPTVTISGPDEVGGEQATATCSIGVSGSGNIVTSISLTNAGSGYTNAANLAITFAGGGGTGAAAIGELVTFQQGTVAVAVTNSGNGYTNGVQTVTISGGGGTGATAVGIVKNNAVQVVVMTNYGQNYTNNANITATISGGGTGANLTPVINNNPNIGIATFSGRVWVAYGRTVAYSASISPTDFTSVSAGTVVITDSTLHGNIQDLLSANNFLYIFGDDSINVFSDVRVDTNGFTVFTNTNVSASVGSQRPNAIFPYFRSVLFLNDYGVYALVGSTTSKISDPLDGIFPNIDFSAPIYAGQVLLNDILCAAFNFRYYDATFTQSYRYVQAVFFEKKWFITSQGNDLAYITSTPVGGKIYLYGVSGRSLYRLYDDSTTNITSRVQTALLPMTDPIRTKQALKIGIEATSSPTGILVMNATVDNENRSSSPYTLTGGIQWQNNSLTVLGWSNNTGANIQWGSGGYNLYKTDAQQYGKYLGITVTSSNPAFTLNGFEFEHELRTRF